MAKTQMSTRRRMAIAAYKPPRAGLIHGSMQLDCSKVVDFIEQARAETGARVTITSFVGAAVGRALRETPSLNGRIHFGKFIPHEDVNVSFLVQIGDGHDLAQVLVNDIDRKSPAEVAQELSGKASRVRRGEDENFRKSSEIAAKLPTWALRRVLSLAGFVNSGLGKPFAGQPAFPFGTCIITSFGMLGVDEGVVPATPFTRVPLYVAVGAIRDMVFAEGGAAVVRPGVTLTATMDHRYVDGVQAANLANSVRRSFENPHSLDPSPLPPE